jgi:hypothetical protein
LIKTNEFWGEKEERLYGQGFLVERRELNLGGEERKK